MTTDIREALARADQRYARRAGYDEPLTPDHLDALAAAIRPLLLGDTPPSDADKTIAQQRGQISSVERERDQLAEQLQEARADFERRDQAARQASEGIARTFATRNEELHKQLNAALTELADLKARDAPHIHTYEWPAPDKPPLPCTCGQPYPRTVLVEQLTKGELVQPDREPFDDLMGQIRDELSTWGNPPSTTKLKGVA